MGRSRRFSHRLLWALVLAAACGGDSGTPAADDNAPGSLEDGGGVKAGAGAASDGGGSGSGSGNAGNGSGRGGSGAGGAGSGAGSGGSGSGDAGAGSGTGGTGGQPGQLPCEVEPPSAWVALPSADRPVSRWRPYSLATEHGMLVYGPPNSSGSPSEFGAHYDLCADAWTPFGAPPFSVDAFNSNAPTVVWTEDEILVWGGYDRSASTTGYEAGQTVEVAHRFDLASSTWSEMNRSGELTARPYAARLWTGDRLLIWGGVAQSGGNTWVNHDGGALYDPATDRWTPIAATGAPTGRGFTDPPIWTGSELIVWSGYRYHTGAGSSPALEHPIDGAIYDPASDVWSPISTSGAPLPAWMVWTGEKVIAIGELDGRTEPGTVTFEGAVFDPSANAWSPMSAPDAGLAAGFWSAGRRLLWAGGELLVFTEREGSGMGVAGLLRYDLDSDSWSSMDLPDSPPWFSWQHVIGAGDKVVIVGAGPATDDADAVPHESTQIVIYDAVTATFTSLPLLEKRSRPEVVVTAGQIVVWGGDDIFPDPNPPTGCNDSPACDPFAPPIRVDLSDGLRIGL